MARIGGRAYQSQRAARRASAEVPAPTAYDHDAAGREAEEIFQARRAAQEAVHQVAAAKEQREIADEIRAAANQMLEREDDGIHPAAIRAFAHLLAELAEFAEHQGKSALVLDALDAARAFTGPGGWPVTEADIPVIGGALVTERPDLAQALNPAAGTRPPTEAEAAEYERRRTDPAWRWLFDPQPLVTAPPTAPAAAPEEVHHLRAVPAAAPVPADPIAQMAATRLAEDQAIKAQRAAQDALNRWAAGQGQPPAKPAPGSPEALEAYQRASNELHYAEQDAAAKADPAETSVMEPPTVIVAAVTDEGNAK